jgi:hypothetical protein
MRSTSLPLLAIWIAFTTAAWAEQPPKEQVLRSAAGEAAAQPSKERVLLGSAPGVTPAPGDSACSLCYTCGGSWPVYGGAIPTRTDAQPWERGAACAGNLAPAPDVWPYLCCR